MSGQDMIWNRLPQTWYEAPFMGNGSMGTYICKEPEKNAIRVDVNNSMVHDHREDDKGIYGRSRLLIGYFLLHPVGEITSGTMRLDLWDAETRGCIRTTSGEIKLRACVTSESPYIIVEAEATEGERGFTWRFYPESTDSPRQLNAILKKSKNHFKKDYISNPASQLYERNGLNYCWQPLLAGGGTATVWKEIRKGNKSVLVISNAHSFPETDALKKALERLTTLVARGTAPDLMICNYVYEHVEDGTSHTVRYTNVFPQNRLFDWVHVRHFRPDQNLLMHSVMYRTEVLRECGMVLPKHTFYVDNIFVYQPLPYVKSMYYMDLDLYRYFIGRADQSVNESVMVGRVDQQLRVTRHMIDCQDLDALKDQKRLRAYMVHYLSVMMAVSDIFLLLDGSAEAKEKQKGLWQYLREHTSAAVYRSIRFGFGGVTNLPFPKGDAIVVGGYRIARKIFKFN